LPIINAVIFCFTDYIVRVMEDEGILLTENIVCFIGFLHGINMFDFASYFLTKNIMACSKILQI
jgi:hypothetical protein